MLNNKVKSPIQNLFSLDKTTKSVIEKIITLHGRLIQLGYIPENFSFNNTSLKSNPLATYELESL